MGLAADAGFDFPWSKFNALKVGQFLTDFDGFRNLVQALAAQSHSSALLGSIKVLLHRRVPLILKPHMA